jgi:hypothetical protein
MSIVDIVDCGEVALYGGLHMKRKVCMDEVFTPQCFVSDDNLSLKPESQIKVKFKQWIEDVNGNPIDELTKEMYYVLKDEVESDEITTPRAFVTEFLNSLWETTTAKSYGFKQQINTTLSILPHDYKSCEVVKSTWYV